MKSNVDLTLNKDFESKNENVTYKFSKKSNTVRNLRNLLNSTFKRGYPWACNNILSSTLNYKQLFFTGNKNERSRKKKEKKYEKECDCCGADLSKRPWSNHYKLCEKCNNWLEEDQENRSLWLRILKNK